MPLTESIINSAKSPYHRAQDYLYGLQQRGWKLGLERMQAAMAELGNPQNNFPSVHIGGTNGKGSVTAMLESIFRHAGYKTGMYTSPHLVELTERIKIKGEELAKSEVVWHVRKIKSLIETLELSFFEAITVIAFLAFAKNKVDIAFIEVGLGGRFDATNVINPLLSVITDISFDHENILGRRLKDIAFEKAGIIKENKPLLIGVKQKIIADLLKNAATKKKSAVFLQKNICEAKNIKVNAEGSDFDLRYPDSVSSIHFPLPGRHQAKNCCTAIAATHILHSAGYEINITQMIAGLKNLKWPARFQKICNQPVILADVAHNCDSFRALKKNLTEIYPHKKIVLLLGVLRDKNFAEIIKIITPVCSRILTVTPESERALNADQLAFEIEKAGFLQVTATNIEMAIRSFIVENSFSEILCITGSHYVVGKALFTIKSLTK